jgi:hypothetical protein
MQITVEINEKDFEFDVSVTDYNDFINSVDAKDKTGPMFNLLKDTVKPEQKTDFIDAMKWDGVIDASAVVAVFGVVAEKVSSRVAVKVKKSSTSPTGSTKTA